MKCKECEHYIDNYEAVDMDTNKVMHYHVCLVDSRRPKIVEKDNEYCYKGDNYVK